MDVQRPLSGGRRRETGVGMDELIREARTEKRGGDSTTTRRKEKKTPWSVISVRIGHKVSGGNAQNGKEADIRKGYFWGKGHVLGIMGTQRVIVFVS